MSEESIFIAALAIPSPAERATFLDQACAGNPALRKEVEQLLAAHAADNPLDRPPANLGRTGADHQSQGAKEPSASVGDRIGPYKLLERIGEGGMGEVWVADQLEPIKRRVAVKLIKPGMDSRSVLARFEAERQALAVMDHPNIAKVFDAGTTPDGRPYFVMELVKGTPITDFCDARKLTPRERLELFVPVCSAIQHAHMKGVIHRDIKPSNVLVALHDQTPVPKVIDFGVAKAIGQSLTEKTIYTAFGALVGTPAYMAPEQATFNQLDIDTRADVYALGVLLYELLSGSTPLEPERLRKAAFDEVLRFVREEEPPRPSQRLSTSQEKATIAAARQCEAEKLSRMMRGELDWIVMKALEKDRARRYDTANALARDVKHYLADEVIEARPPSMSYRLRKVVRRHKGQVLAALLVLLTLVGGIIGTSWQAIRAERQAQRAEAEAQRVQDEQRKSRAALERAELYLVGGLLRPLGDSAHVYLAQGELKALSDIAQLPEARLKMLCLTEALNHPEIAFQVARRAERFVQATVGSDPTIRDEALALVAAKQQDSSLDVRIRLAACWLAMELGSRDLPAFAEGVKYVPTSKPGSWANFITPTLRNTLSAKEWAILAEVLIKHGLVNAQTRHEGIAHLQDIGGRLHKNDLTRLCDYLIDANNSLQDYPRDVPVREFITNVLKTWEPYLDSRMATRWVARLLSILKSKKNPDEYDRILKLIEPLAARVDETLANRLAETLIRKNEHGHRYGGKNSIAKILLAVAPRLTGPQIQSVATELISFCDPASARDHSAHAAGRALVLLAPHLSGDEAWPLLNKLIKAFPELYESGDVPSFAAMLEAVLALARRVDVSHLSSICQDSAAKMLELMTQQNSTSHEKANAGWQVIGPYLGPEDGCNLALLLVDNLGSGVSSTNAASTGIITMAHNFDLRMAETVAAKLLTRITASIEIPFADDNKVFSTLDAVLARGDSATAQHHLHRAAQALSVKLGDKLSPFERVTALKRLAHVTKRLSAGDRQLFANRVNEMCLGILPAAKNTVDVGHLLSVLDDLTPVLSDTSIQRLAEQTLGLIRTNGDDRWRDTCAAIVLKLASRLDTHQVRRTVPVLLEVYRTRATWSYQTAIEDILSTVAARLDPVEDRELLHRAIKIVSSRLPKMHNLRFQVMLGAILAMTDRLRVTDRQPILAQLLRDMLADAASDAESAQISPRPELLERLLGQVTEVELLAKYLRHPACIEPWRTPMLRRLEQLCLPPPRSEEWLRFAVCPQAIAPLCVVISAQKVLWEQNRKFQTAWDFLRWQETQKRESRSP